MKQTDLYQAAQSITPDPHLKARLAAVVTPVPKRRPLHSLGVVMAACVLLALSTTLLYMNAAQEPKETALPPGAGFIMDNSPETPSANSPDDEKPLPTPTPENSPDDEKPLPTQDNPALLSNADWIAFQIAAYQAATAYLKANVSELSTYMVNPDEATDFLQGMSNIYDEVEYLILIWGVDGIKSEHEIEAAYRFALKGADFAQYVSMSLVKVNDAWKVRWIIGEG
ncbi:MAG: L-histidine N(alpha)-methyltransferase [Oscillospiraceae bacterium]|nr:L-histidine N(alpha)-methyltransferase [Oscillospiraceae bacterium]